MVSAASVIHPDTAMGYRLECDGHALAYLPDHEPVLSPSFPDNPRWTSGLALAHEADLLVHDGQYSADEYPRHRGWGHSSVRDAVAFAQLAAARRLTLFHHDPSHDDHALARLEAEAGLAGGDLYVEAARQGATVTLER
jgi:phosphoribosyl 1,2-cyclic phosphodiesterase